MKIASFIRKYSLWGFLFTFVLAICLRVLLGSYFSSNEYAVSIIKGNLDKSFSKIDHEFEQLISITAKSKDLNFASLLSDWQYPLVVYSGDYKNEGIDSIHFWSHYQAGLNHIYEEKGITKLPNGSVFFVTHRPFNIGSRQYFAQAILPLYLSHDLNNKYLESQWNEDIFPFQEVSMDSASKGESVRIDFGSRTEQEQLQLVFQDRSKDIISGAFGVFLTTLLLVSIFLFYLFCFFKSETYVKSNKVIAIFWLLVPVAVFQFFLEYTELPLWLFQSALFDSSEYASASWTSSFGELVIITIVALLFAVWLRRNLTNLTGSASKWLVIQTLLLSILSLLFVYHFVETLFEDSQYALGIKNLFDFQAFHLVSWMILIGLTVAYLIVCHSCYSNSKLLLREEWKLALLVTVVASIGLYAFTGELYLLPWLNLAYLFLLIYLDLPASTEVFQFKTFIYFFSAAFVASLIAAGASFSFQTKDHFEQKQNFASSLLNANDSWMEISLSEAMEKIKQDRFIESVLFNKLSGKESISRKIERFYLNQNFFDQYDINIVCFDAQGSPFGRENGVNFFKLRAQAEREQYRTEFPNIFLLQDLNSNRYIGLLEFERRSEKQFIAIELRLKRVVPNSVFPELFMDEQYKTTVVNRDLEFAWFDNGVLKYNSGRFPINADFDREKLLDHPEGLTDGDKHVILYQGEQEQEIIISSDFVPTQIFMSAFSFFYVCLLMLIFIGLIVFALFVRWRNIQLNYATKIQLYINSAFFIPLLIVCLVTYQLVSTSYEEELQEQYLITAKKITLNLNDEIESYFRLSGSEESLEEAVADIARYTVTDINLFNRNGRLIAYNQPLLFEKQLLSRRINPEAFARIIEQNSEQVILDESIGGFSYKATYGALRSSDNASLTAVVSIPFFESKEELRAKLGGVISNITNIFTVIFLLSLLVSYFASKNLTFPLRFIAQKIKGTDLQERNEPISWNSNDEIGLLVGSYNNMIAKLEESKEALSKSEKESAWREMAKQVAHEIKNPLTPMKLTLQHLQRVLNRREGLQQELEKPVGTLLRQIETLSDIATSFSSFAKMPVPRNEVFDIIALLKQTVGLYKNHQRADITSIIPNEVVSINGDEKLIGRSLTNLILNGIQAVPESRRALIEVSALVLRDLIRVKIKDNGSGISEDFREKVFIPNFSTKETGSGIGLAISKRGVEHAGGKIWFDTIIDEGTTFYLEFPINQRNFIDPS